MGFNDRLNYFGDFQPFNDLNPHSTAQVNHSSILTKPSNPQTANPRFIMEKYQEKGREIYNKFCKDSSTPTMLPPAPEQVYIDKYPDVNCSSWDGDKQRQSDYETEVIMYRALEELEERLVVLHSFEFTHHQYCLCDKSHVRDKKKCKGCKSPANREGECDFLVVGAEFCVVIEVKNMSNLQTDTQTNIQTNVEEDRDNHCKALVGTYRKSEDQRNKITSLIKCIDLETLVLQFTAYPNFSKRYKNQFQDSKDVNYRLSDQELSTLIFLEDITGERSNEQGVWNCSSFSRWWELNVKKTIMSVIEKKEECTETQIPNIPSGSNDKVRDMLLAVWATDKNFCDLSKCSLGKSIKDIDKSLREGRITMEPKKGKKRNQNPGVVKAPDIIKEFLDIQYLTAEQNTAFNSNERLVWINGPAGAGKSVVLCGKIIELAQRGDVKKIVLMRFIGKGNNSDIYERAFSKAGVNYAVFDVTSEFEEERCHDPVDQVYIMYEIGCQILVYDIQDYSGVVGVLYELIDLLKQDDCLFIDDLHRILYATEALDCEEFLEKLLEVSGTGNVWITCDLAQGYYFEKSHFSDLIDVITKKLSASQQIILSSNLRNTFDIAEMLRVIRHNFYKEFSDNRSDVLRIIMPTQIPGHFIHGPKPVFHILHEFNVKLVGQILEATLKNLLNFENCLDRSDVAIVCNHPNFGDEEPEIIDDAVTKFCSDPDEDANKTTVSVCQYEDSCSAEWPAVIVVHEMGVYSDRDLTRLYLALSRARVFCSAIVYPGEATDADNHSQTRDLLDQLKCYVHLRNY